MNKKILLISANRLHDPYPIYPIGISYLATYLKKSLPGIEILTFDMNRGTSEELASIIVAQKPDYIGVSIRNIDGANSFDQKSFIPDYEEITIIVKKNSSAPLILGGAGFSLYPKILFDRLNADFAVKGEGEKALTELITCLETGSDYSAIEGLIYRKNGVIVLNQRTSFSTSLTVNYEPDLVDWYWQHSGMLNIQTKRGCYHRCVYCSYPLIEGRRVRTLETEEVIDNIERLLREKNINYVFFTDSLFNIDRRNTMELAETIIRRGLKVNWAAYFSPSNLTDEELALYKRSGLTHIEFGTESFCDEQLRNYGKDFDFETVLKTSELALKNNIFYAHFMILGGYGETDATLAETFENSRLLRYTVIFPFVGMRIYPGTALQQYAIRDGVIAADDDLLEPRYYISRNFEPSTLKARAQATGKAWVFPDDISETEMQAFRLKRNKKGLIWEYLRKP
ncbi:MAG: radical SAM protein [Dysgonamonadaceae bacterium]|jgi:radical SAM superfamily enzyme YgiQ (UPF0313 family)|nr:radical SAM protein [Dysgonamonadaceae bacterium]